VQVDLNNQVAFVCGSNSGIGRAIAVVLAKNGADIVLNGRAAASAREVIDEIQPLGRKVIFEKADITEYHEMRRAVDHALSEFGKIDILVVSGGVTGSGLKSDLFLETPTESYLAWAKTRWCSRLYCVRAVLDHMVERHTGKIVLISTDAGRWPTPAECMAGSLGAAVVMTTKVLAQELSRWQIRVNTICLTAMEGTPSYDYATQLSARLAGVFKKALAKQPFRVTSEDVANAALFFCSDESKAITGQILSVNGGLSFPG